jgi:hypothetical protein
MPAKKKTTSTSRARAKPKTRATKAAGARPRASRARASAPREEQVRFREEPAPGPSAAAGSPFTASPFTPGMAPECLMCPFGLFFFTMRNTRPEVMEHLTAAGHELFLAFQALVQQTGERWEQAQSLQRITVR